LDNFNIWLEELKDWRVSKNPCDAMYHVGYTVNDIPLGYIMNMCHDVAGFTRGEKIWFDRLIIKKGRLSSP